MNYGPLARIVLRYGIGYFAGSEIGDQMSLDPDLQMVVAVAAGAVVEAAYAYAKKKGWAT